MKFNRPSTGCCLLGKIDSGDGDARSDPHHFSEPMVFGNRRQFGDQMRHQLQCLGMVAGLLIIAGQRLDWSERIVSTCPAHEQKLKLPPGIVELAARID